jgi:RimJ/RimL family protein N-acetyltransferase
MFVNDRIRLRPATPDDAAAIYEISSDPETHLISDDRPFIPQSLPALVVELEKRITDPGDGAEVGFLAETVADGTFLGIGIVWGIDSFNQYGHLGITLAPSARGKGYGRDVTALLCRYGFRNRNLRRLEIETLASNAPMRRVAEACGFIHEGTQRQREYDGDGYADIAIYGLLRSEWSA